MTAAGRHPDHSAPADIPEAAGRYVWYVLYLIPLRKLVRPDASQGRQYAYPWVKLEGPDCRGVAAHTYHVPYAAPEERLLIREAAEQRGLPHNYRTFPDRVEARL